MYIYCGEKLILSLSFQKSNTFHKMSLAVPGPCSDFHMNTTLPIPQHSYKIKAAVFPDCGPLSNPENGLVQHALGTIYGQTATYLCNARYILTGSQTRQCAADGRWTNSAPTCEEPRKYIGVNLSSVLDL